ncbi:MAG: translation initiation factor IF-2 [Anaerolineae bacterium]|nr:translation initiation factor IF-2 [Anaerolineae bacterium]MCX8067790.1 translation initiation factor IF-2 [Anaerolineae bacterium]MDW7991156.1 translation initiation factor IF-2 [Anaerolineae bacterium]
MVVKEAPVKEKAKSQPRVIELPASLTVRELAQRLGVSPIDVIKRLMYNGIMATINQQIDYETAAIVASDLGFETVEERAPEEAVEEEGVSPLWARLYAGEDPANLRPRPPVVTVLGHVDHGKTSLLDAIRKTNVAEGEVGGITQHIGAYQVEHNGRLITFLDTPGHEAFTAMRARGAQTTDIAVLVVAADDGVMPQTVEALNHARAARVPVIVALNKIDKPTAQPERVKRQLSDLGLVPDEWGGDTLVIPVSAKKRIGIEDLLEAILLVAESQNIRANPNRPAVGTVLEAELDRAKGPTATVLVQNGTLRVGDAIVAGTVYGRVRRMLDSNGKPVREAPPSTPVQVIGLSGVPEAGDMFEVVADEKTARAIATKRLEEKQARAARAVRALTLDDLSRSIRQGQAKELNLIIKADVQGSIEPIVTSLNRLSTDQVKVNIIHAAAGAVTESDVNLAIASKAIIIGFQVSVDPAARRLAESEGVDIRLYDIIYELVDEVELALKGLLEPTYVERVIGKAEVRATFDIPKVGRVAGCYVLEGEIRRNSRARVYRQGELKFDGPVASLKRFAKDVREVKAGYECGLGLEGFHDFVVGDVIEFYVKERAEVQPTIARPATAIGR